MSRTFGEALKAYRKKHNLSQADVGGKIGVHASSVGHWERGLGMNQTTWKKFAPVFVDLATILPPFTSRPREAASGKKTKKGKKSTLRLTVRKSAQSNGSLNDASLKLAAAFGEFGRVKTSIAQLRSQLDDIIHQASTLRAAIDTAANDAATATNTLIAALEGDVN